MGEDLASVVRKERSREGGEFLCKRWGGGMEESRRLDEDCSLSRNRVYDTSYGVKIGNKEQKK